MKISLKHFPKLQELDAESKEQLHALLRAVWSECSFEAAGTVTLLRLWDLEDKHPGAGTEALGQKVVLLRNPIYNMGSDVSIELEE